MPELGWVRLSEGALEHLLDHLVGTRHSGFGVIEYRDISNVANALWEIKDHNLKGVVSSYEPEEEPRFDVWAKAFKGAMAESVTAESLKAGAESTGDASGKACDTGQGPVEAEALLGEGRTKDEEGPQPDGVGGEALAGPVARSAEAEKPLAKKKLGSPRGGRRGIEETREYARECGVTMDDFERALLGHGKEGLMADMGLKSAQAVSTIFHSRANSVPTARAVDWVVVLRGGAKPESIEGEGEEDKPLPALIPWARARHCCYTRVSANATERRMVAAWVNSGSESIEEFLTSTYSHDELGVRVP